MSLSTPRNPTGKNGVPKTPCSATSKRTGEPCQARPAVGATVCRSHGGAAPQVRKQVVKAFAAKTLLDLGFSPSTDPVQDLRDVVGALRQTAGLLAGQLDEVMVSTDYGRSPAPELKAWLSVIDALRKAAESLARVNLEGRVVDAVEVVTAAEVAALTALVLDALRPHPEARQRVLVALESA